MNEKKASVHWEGRGKQGVGRIATETGVLKDAPYGFAIDQIGRASCRERE